MLSDRPYMRETYQRERTSVLTWLISAIIAGFIIQAVMASSWFRGEAALDRMFGLSIPGLETWRVWTLLSHAFLHSTQFPLHVVGILFALYFLGRELLPMLGPKRFLGLFVAATVVGGMAWSAVHWRLADGEMLFGAMAAVDALFIVFACFFPNQQLSFLLFFLVPVTLRPKHVALGLVAFDVLSMAFYEIPGAPLPFDMKIASSAHLGGMVVGLLYYRFVHDARWFTSAGDRPEVELPRWMRRARKPVNAVPPALPPPSTPEDIRAEVDRILDKINSDGFGALTAQEKRVLDEAKDVLSRR